jgi:hypothetical protein
MKVINRSLLILAIALTGACASHEKGDGKRDGARHEKHHSHQAAEAESSPMMQEHMQAMHKNMQDMHKNMQAMQETMQKIHATKSPAERQKLMQHHMAMMQDNMKMMSCPAMNGNGMDGMKMDGMKDMPMMSNMDSADKKSSMPMMAGGKQCPMGGMMMKRMDMMQMMMDQMMQHMAAQQPVKK